MSRSFLILAAVTISILANSTAERGKRMLFGDTAHSHTEWNTQHLVTLVKSWACLTDQINHVVTGCEFIHYCSGSLITNDFVLTATHCVEYIQVFGRGPYLDQIKNFGFSGRLFYAFFRIFLVREHLHKFYSNVAILAGSTDINKMSQKRHAERVFPHPNYVYGALDEFSLDDHDVAIVRVCVPFETTQTVKPKPLPLKDVKQHWDSVVARNALCIFLGYGNIVVPGTWWIYEEARGKGLTYIWRYLACSAWCNKNLTRTEYQLRNPCHICSTPFAPRYALPGSGDSGGPIICDGLVTGVITAGSELTTRNISEGTGYALHCIRNAVTPERLAFYKTVPGRADLIYLGPVEGERQHRHKFGWN